MGPKWGPSRADRTQVGPMLAQWTLLSGMAALCTDAYWIAVKLLISPVITRMLTYMYCNSKIRVMWDNTHWNYFDVTNEVNQGVILYPLLVSMYVEDLITILDKDGRWCWVGKEYYGIAICADDMVLLSPSLMGLQSMFDRCKQLGLSQGLTVWTIGFPWYVKWKCFVYENVKWPKIDIKSWFASPVVIIKFSLCERRHFHLLNRDVDTIFFAISFSRPLPGNMILNREIDYSMAWKRECTIYSPWKREFGTPIAPRSYLQCQENCLFHDSAK